MWRIRPITEHTLGFLQFQEKFESNTHNHKMLKLAVDFRGWRRKRETERQTVELSHKTEGPSVSLQPSSERRTASFTINKQTYSVSLIWPFTFRHQESYCRLDVRGIESRWGRDFSHPSRPAPNPTQPHLMWVSSLFPGGKAAGAWCWHPLLSNDEVKSYIG